ncbi:MAG: hypothetical protein ACP5E9_01980 [Candidatus Methanospirareceae archaeon]
MAAGKSTRNAVVDILNDRKSRGNMIETDGKNISRREIKLISFICNTYCPFCKNDKCNAEQIMVKYDTTELTPVQAKEIPEFKLNNASCQNHIPDEGFLMFGHKIEIHYSDGRVELKKGWYTTTAISELWRDDVEYVDIIFSDL